MRLLVLLATVLLIPAYAVVLERCYEWQQKTPIEARCRQELDAAGLRGISLTLNHLDATLAGICLDPDGRVTAQRIIESTHVLRVKEGDNHVQTPAKITAKFIQQSIALSGWVDSDQTRRHLLEVVKRFRPDLPANADAVNVSPHVVMGPSVPMAVGAVPESIATFLETVRAPSSLSVTPEKGVLHVHGFLPSIDLRARVVSALHGKAGQWTLETAALHASEHVAHAPFTKDDALPAFLQSYYGTPTPGSFSIDVRKGPQLKAYATPELITQWLALLRPMCGAAHVPLDGITYVPTIYHFPGYQPESVLAPGVDAESLQTLFKAQPIYFATGSSTIEPTEQLKLGPLVIAINSAGPGAKFIVAGYADVGGETASYQGVISGLRATAVKKLLLRLGVSDAGMEVQSFDLTHPGEVITEQARHDSRRVELLLK